MGSYDCGGWASFAHTVLVDFRARLDRSGDDRRIFNRSVEVASEAGLVGAKRVLDSTPLYDAVATMDTITLIRSAIRGLLKVADAGLEVQLRALISSGDDYASSAKPQIDWDDQAAREELVHSRAGDGYAILACLDSCPLEGPLADAASLLATVLGQDLEEGDDGVFRLARRVAKDRVISTVDPEARHGHFWPSSRFRKPLPLIAQKCTNTSGPPSSWVMKPKPFSPLNHFTVPVAIAISPFLARIDPADDSRPRPLVIQPPVVA